MSRQHGRKRERALLTAFGQLQVGSPRVLLADRPLGLPVADEPYLVQPNTGTVRSLPSRVSVRCMLVVTSS